MSESVIASTEEKSLGIVDSHLDLQLTTQLDARPSRGGSGGLLAEDEESDKGADTSKSEQSIPRSVIGFGLLTSLLSGLMIFVSLN